MLEDLIKLKQELEKNNKYIALRDIDIDEIMNAGESKSILEFEKMENTDNFIYQCQKLFEEAVRIFSTNDIPYDKIQFITTLGFLCKQEFVESMKNQHLEDDGVCLDVEDLGSNVSLKYVPLEFSIDFSESGLKTGESVDAYCFGKQIPELEELSEKNIYGIVDFDKFIKKISELGYELEFLDVGYGDCKCNSIHDYINASIDRGDDGFLCIRANFDYKKTK